jgi:uncharacterized protein YcbX
LSVRPSETGERRPAQIWRDTVAVVDQGGEASEWLSAHLGTPARLVRLPAESVRPIDPTYATRPTDQVSLADGFPLLLVSEESLVDLNRRLAEPLPMNRFRPNVVVRGWGVAYGEDTWAAIRIGQVKAAVVKACARCVITTTDQRTAERGIEPLATLATYRRVAHGVAFGQNLIPTSTGLIQVGDRVMVMQAGAQSATHPVGLSPGLGD